MKSNWIKILNKQIIQLQNMDFSNAIGKFSHDFFKKNFEDEGMNDTGLVKWQLPKRKIQGTREYKYAQQRIFGRKKKKKDKFSNVYLKTLQQTGKLRKALFAPDALRVRNSKKFHHIKIIVTGSKVPYAWANNYGVSRSNIPSRQFLYQSTVLNRGVTKLIIKKVNEALKVNSYS